MSGLLARIIGAIAAICLTVGILALSVPAYATSAVSCPTVARATGAVNPAPAPGVDWAGCDLVGADLRLANLTGANLSKADLSGADLGGAMLTSADLSGTNLSVGNYAGIISGGIVGTPSELPNQWTIAYGYLLGPLANLDGARLAGANLSGLIMDEVTLKDANLTGADLTNIDLADASLSGATLTNADLDHATLGAVDLSDVALGGATLTGADLYAVSSGGITGTPAALPANYSIIAGYLIGPDVVLANASLSGVNLSSADLHGADAIDANLGGANLSNANLTDSECVGTVLTGANLAGTAMTGVNFTYVRSGSITGVPASLPTHWLLLSGFLLGPGTNLSNANLAGVNLSTADLAAANLSGANLTGADFGTASLLNATLAGANLSGAVMAGANLSSVHSGSISGTPASLPANWLLTDGYLVGPDAYLATADLAAANLASADLASANLINADLEGANLSGANLTKGHMSDIDLSGANLSGANLTGARMDYAKLAGTDLTNATLTDVWSGYISGAPAALPANWQLVHGYFIGPGAFLVEAVLPGANLAGSDLAGADLIAAYLDDASLAHADLASADLGDAYLAYANLDGANLTGAQFTGANLTDASLDGATVTPANFTGVTWLNTICPDGSNSNKYVAGCFSALNTSKPTASPAVTSGTVGANGWYVSPVTVTWNWTDQGPINASACTESSRTSASGDPVTLTATCTDLAGNVGTARYSVKVDATRPDVRVTGVRHGATYALGDVPQGGCRSSDTISGIATLARLTVTTAGHRGVGKFTATCAGAVTVAGLKQESPVSVSYVVEYGFGGFSSPRANVRLRRSSALGVTFRLTGPGGKPLSSALAAALGHARAVLVTLTGPGIKPVTATCAWSSRSKQFSCTLRPPRGIQAGRAYEITAMENVGAGFAKALPAGTARNPETIRFS